MNLNLPASIFSPQDLKSILFEIQNYSKWFEQASIKARVAKTKVDSPPILSDPAAQLINDVMNNEAVSQKNLDILIKELTKLVDDLPQITIILAGPASSSLKKTLVDWCRKNIKPNILVVLKFNSTILGGLVIEYNSHIYDLSFRRKILASRDKFPEVLRNV